MLSLLLLPEVSIALMGALITLDTLRGVNWGTGPKAVLRRVK